jgi:signal transduction histidine kinase
LGQCDILSAAAYSEAREKVMVFSRPYYKTLAVMATRNTDLFIEDLNLILDKPLGVVRGNYLVDRIKELKKDTNIVETDNIHEGLEMLGDGQLFAFLDTIPAISYAAQQAGITNIRIAGQLEFSNQFHITALKGNEKLISIFNKAIDTLTDQDRLTITARWSNVQIDHQTDYALLLKFVFAFGLISLFFMYRHFALSRLNRELNEANKKAQQATIAKSEFLATMSHEIRTPLNAILGMNEVLRESDLSAEQHKHLQISKNAGETLLALINDVLDLSKIEAGQIDLSIIDFNLYKLIENTSDIQMLLAHEKGINFDVELDSKMPQHVKGDPDRLRQILLNLLNNAIKFTSSGGVVFSVSKK